MSDQTSLNPYLTFYGQCEEAFNFYAKCLGVKVGDMHRFKDMPGEQPSEPGLANQIMHTSLTFNGQTLMGSDGMPGMPNEGHKGFTLSLNVTSQDDAERLFKAFSEGGQVTMPLAATFFAKSFGFA